MAKMAAVCDVYDAVTSERPYKSGWDPADALRRMAEWKGHFDPSIFQALVKSLGIYPIGSLLRLSSGRLGVVVEQSPQSNLRIPPEVIDLSRPSCTDKIASREDPDQWCFPDLVEMWAGLAGRAPL